MSASDINLFDLDLEKKAIALRTWSDECMLKMRNRYPKIDSDADIWHLKNIYNTKIENISISTLNKYFHGKDPSYNLAVRCFFTELALKDEIKSVTQWTAAWKCFSSINVPLFKINRWDLVELEKKLFSECEEYPKKAGRISHSLTLISKYIDRFSALGIVDALAWVPSNNLKIKLRNISLNERKKMAGNKGHFLDMQIEALSDAQAAMFRGDERLSSYDCAALAVMGINMCCPNRINEPLCMSLDDRFTLNDFIISGSNGDPKPSNSIERVHQMLLMKGSKGAQWSAKPILNFMIDFLNLCIDTIKKHGHRSRTLVAWYERNPDTIYLPPELEYLRGMDLDRKLLWRVINLEDRDPLGSEIGRVGSVWRDLLAKGVVYEGLNPNKYREDGSLNTRTKVQKVSWEDIEFCIIDRVKKAINDIRRVSKNNHYQGKLSKMLMLFDFDVAKYLPGSIKYNTLRKRFHANESDRLRQPGHHGDSWVLEPTIFEKLDIKMVVNRKIQYAYIKTHDPRRWLTTQALESGLSDILVNKWANRLSINQIKAYDFRSSEGIAEQSAMPDLKEIPEITNALQRIGVLESDYGLNNQVISISDANISLTSVDDVMQATENRPVARTSNQILILYPQRYGVCLHQHHERPCRSYKCAPCNEGFVVKGHLPSNEQIMKDSELIFRSIVNQLEALLIARNRQIADDPETLDEHILTLVRDGLSSENMAKELIERFHDINEQIKDRAFANKLAEAFALTGYAEQLRNENNSAGAIIKYHNPTYHAAPGHERVLDSVHGGRLAVKFKIEEFEKKYPQFSQITSDKKDERYLIEFDDDYENDE